MKDDGNKEILELIGSNIRKLRRAESKNYEVFANDHGINKVTLSRIENGQDFKMSNLIKLLIILNISLSDFFNDLE